MSCWPLIVDDINIVIPSPYDFGDAPIGTTTPAVTFTVTNIGVTTHGPIVVTLMGQNPTAFTVVADTCSGTSLTPPTGCTFGLTFTPKAAGPVIASVRVVAELGHQVSTTAVLGNGL